MPQAVAAQRLQHDSGLTFAAEGYGHSPRPGGAQPQPTRPSAPSCSAWACRSSAPTRAWSTPGHAFEEVPPPGQDGRDRHPRPDGLHGPATREATAERPSSSFDGRRVFRAPRRPGPHGIDEGYFFHHRPPQAHDQRQRLQGPAGAEVEPMLFKCPAAQEARVIAAKDAYRARPSGLCCAPKPRPAPGPRSSSPGRASTWRLAKVPKIVEFVRCAAQSRVGQGDVAPAVIQEASRSRELPASICRAGSRCWARPVCDSRRHQSCSSCCCLRARCGCSATQPWRAIRAWRTSLLDQGRSSALRALISRSLRKMSAR